jgi:hypothetical protein
MKQNGAIYNSILISIFPHRLRYHTWWVTGDGKAGESTDEKEEKIFSGM